MNFCRSLHDITDELGIVSVVGCRGKLWCAVYIGQVMLLVLLSVYKANLCSIHHRLISFITFLLIEVAQLARTFPTAHDSAYRVRVSEHAHPDFVQLKIDDLASMLVTRCNWSSCFINTSSFHSSTFHRALTCNRSHHKWKLFRRDILNNLLLTMFTIDSIDSLIALSIVCG